MANLWQRLDLPLKVGIGAAILSIIMTVIGIFRDPNVPVTVWSIIMGSLIAGGVWGIVTWAIATAAVEVEADVKEAQDNATHEQADDPN